MNLNRLELNGILILRPNEAKLDAQNCAMLKNAVKDAIGNKWPNIVIDLALVSDIDSLGLTALLCCHKMIGTEGKLIFATPQPKVANSFSLTRLTRTLSIAASREQALQMLSSKQHNVETLKAPAINGAPSAWNSHSPRQPALAIVSI